jgi:2-methylisocitrate lyase-like PEP mutase family enzyme
MADDLRDRFRALHAAGLFVMPNPWDVGSARMLAEAGFPALATTSSGHARTLGRNDQQVTRDELLVHAAALVAAVDVPVSVDAERCFADDPAGVADTVRLIAATGAAGCSIEDYDPASGRIEPLDVATGRVAAAANAARETGMVLTARAERHLYGDPDLDDSIARLCAYRDAGAEVVYAPGLTDLPDIVRVVEETATAVNVLLAPGAPSIAELAAAGVRRVSTGGALSAVAYDAAMARARTLLPAIR